LNKRAVTRHIKREPYDLVFALFLDYPPYSLHASLKFKDEVIEIFLGLFQNQLCAFHAVVVLRHILLDDQTPIALADLVSLVPGALPPTLGGFEAGGYEKAF